jgi:hypothetical protein
MFSLINFAVAQAVLRNQNLDSGTVNRDSVVAGLLPSFIGLALPLIVARSTPPPPPQTSGSTGTIVTKVPDVTTGNPAVAEADTVITNAGLISTHEFAYDENTAQGYVLDQDPAAGVYVPLQSTVTIIVSNGKPSAQAVHPALAAIAGFDLADLQKLAQEQQKFVEEQQKFAEQRLEAHQDKLSKAMEEKIQASEKRILDHIAQLHQAARRGGGNPLPP